MSNIVKIKDFTYKDIREYVNRRACDGNWDVATMLIIRAFMMLIPKGNRRKKDKFVKEHIGEIFNLNDYPDLSVNIDNGKIYETF